MNVEYMLSVPPPHLSENTKKGQLTFLARKYFTDKCSCGFIKDMVAKVERGATQVH
jgi:hypothetical protein